MAAVISSRLPDTGRDSGKVMVSDGEEEDKDGSAVKAVNYRCSRLHRQLHAYLRPRGRFFSL
jgi:hypothetical protein